MSSILEALKRLEKEEAPPPGTSRRPSWYENPSIHRGWGKGLAGFFLARRGAVWTGAVLILAIGVVALLIKGGLIAGSGSGSGERPAVAPVPIASNSDTALTEEAGVSKKTEGVPVKTGPRPPKEPALGSERPIAGPAPKSTAAATAAKKAPPALRPGPESEKPSKKSPLPQARKGEAEPAAARATSPPPVSPHPAPEAAVLPGAAGSPDQPLKDERPGPEAEASTTGQAAMTGPGSEPVLSATRSLPEQAGLSLQAISWSETPGKRIAVINGRILKEGELIEEYTVVQIRADDVVFRHSGQLWLLGFERR